MKKKINYQEAREMLLASGRVLEKERIPLEEAEGRVLAQEVIAAENVPAFDRSPYDGYALRAEDTKAADREHPVVLRILEEVPAGAVPTKAVHAGEAVKILTGAPIPEGADAVIMYEKTEYTEECVSIFTQLKSGENIVRAGEDVKQGQILAAPGMKIDPGLAGSLAGQGIYEPEVYRKPRVGIISTGSELVDAAAEEQNICAGECDSSTDSNLTDTAALAKKRDSSADSSLPENAAYKANMDRSLRVLPAGKIRNTNRYTLAAALRRDGCIPQYLGTVGDRVCDIAALIVRGLEEAHCDMILLTGGVSAGDYDLTPDAMEQAGCVLFAKGVAIKPGMACCYGVRDGKLVCGLSGNPSSSLINYYAVVQPAVRQMSGQTPAVPETFTVELAEGFSKKSPQDRFLKGCLKVEDGKAVFHAPKGQGNTMIGSFTGCDCLAVIPAGSGPVEAGGTLEAFRI